MRKLEHQAAALRGVLRRAAARRATVRPDHVQPARLVLRLDDGDLPGSVGEGTRLSPARWRNLMVSAVEWLGPVPVTIRAWRSAGSAEAVELVRFAHRMECPTELETAGDGVDLDKAKELCDRGLRRLRVVIGGVSPEVHAQVVGGELDRALAAVRAAHLARADRGAPLDLEVAIPWRDPAHLELRAVLGWAREAGADGFRVLPPWIAVDLPSDPEALDALDGLAPGFHRTPAASIAELHAMAAHQDGRPGMRRDQAPARRRRMPCPVGGQRLEITAAGRLLACPFHPPIAQGLGDGEHPDLKVLFAQAQPHLSAIRACERACAHPELAPARLLPR